MGTFCKNENIISNITLKQGLDFLTHLFKKVNKYWSISAARSSFVKLATTIWWSGISKAQTCKKGYARYIYSPHYENTQRFGT